MDSQDTPERSGHAGRWLTYTQLGEARGIGRASAVTLARKKKWRREPGNDGTARVLVPEDWLTLDPRRPQREAAPERSPQPSPPALRVIEQALETLREQLVRERGRADRAESMIDRLQAEIDALRAGTQGHPDLVVELPATPAAPASRWARFWRRRR